MGCFDKRMTEISNTQRARDWLTPIEAEEAVGINTVHHITLAGKELEEAKK